MENVGSSKPKWKISVLRFLRTRKWNIKTRFMKTRRSLNISGTTTCWNKKIFGISDKDKRFYDHLSLVRWIIFSRQCKIRLMKKAMVFEYFWDNCESKQLIHEITIPSHQTKHRSSIFHLLYIWSPKTHTISLTMKKVSRKRLTEHFLDLFRNRSIFHDYIINSLPANWLSIRLSLNYPLDYGSCHCYCDKTKQLKKYTGRRHKVLTVGIFLHEYDKLTVKILHLISDIWLWAPFIDWS